MIEPDQVTTLTGPLSTLIAGSFGALAALVGAFVGAWMQSRSQERHYQKQLEQQRLALAGAIIGELTAVNAAIIDKKKILLNLDNESNIAAARAQSVASRLGLPKSTVFETTAHRLGILGPTIASEIARIYAYKSTIEGMLNACERDLEKNSVSPKIMEARAKELSSFESEVIELIGAGKPLALIPSMK